MYPPLFAYQRTIPNQTPKFRVDLLRTDLVSSDFFVCTLLHLYKPILSRTVYVEARRRTNEIVCLPSTKMEDVETDTHKRKKRPHSKLGCVYSCSCQLVAAAFLRPFSRAAVVVRNDETVISPTSNDSRDGRKHNSAASRGGDETLLTASCSVRVRSVDTRYAQ